MTYPHNPVDPAGRWTGRPVDLISDPEGVTTAIRCLPRPVFCVSHDHRVMVTHSGHALIGHSQTDGSGDTTLPLLGFSPSLMPEQLGEPAFKARHRLTYAYIAGAMANGITSEEMVCAMGEAGMLGFFGAAGLSPERVEEAIERIRNRLGDRPFGFNLIHSPHEPDLEAAIVDLYIRRGVHLVSASAYLQMTLPLVRYRLHGIHRDSSDRICCPNRIIAKVSRVEVAEKFFSPPPQKLLDQLVAQGHLTPEQAEMAATIPMADDMTAEADSGGHTDNRPALALLPTLLHLKDRMQKKHGYPEPLHVGLAGGIATPQSVAAAFSMGAAYVLAGSINQACVEAGTCEAVREMLAQAGQADVVMAPAADMFEMGVKVQVLKRGTMFAIRAAKLYDLYRGYRQWEEIPDRQRSQVERECFHRSFHEEWQATRAFFLNRDPRQVERAEKDPHHLMALVFRSYLGQSSKWPVNGVAERQIDYQIWCGPAMGAFNEWAQGSFLESIENRTAVTVAVNLLTGACALIRAGWLRQQGVPLPPSAMVFPPVPLSDIQSSLEVPSP